MIFPMCRVSDFVSRSLVDQIRCERASGTMHRMRLIGLIMSNRGLDIPPGASWIYHWLWGSRFQAPVAGRPSALPPASRERSLPLNTNLLLNVLPDAEREALAPHLKPVALKQRDLLYDVRQEVNKVYFATDAVVSLVVPLSTGEVVESAMVGGDGIVGAGAALNGRVSLNRAIVQIGGECLACPVDPLILLHHKFFRRFSSALSSMDIAVAFGPGRQ